MSGTGVGGGLGAKRTRDGEETAQDKESMSRETQNALKATLPSSSKKLGAANADSHRGKRARFGPSSFSPSTRDSESSNDPSNNGLSSSIYVSSSSVEQKTDRLSSLPSELLLRILHQLPLSTILTTSLLSHKWQHLSNDPQVWKRLYYIRFVRPRALRIPGLKDGKDTKDGAPGDNGKGLFDYSSRRSRWLDEESLLGGEEWKRKRMNGEGLEKEVERTDWKARYRLRHNWSIGSAEVREIGLGSRSHPAEASTGTITDEEENSENEDTEEKLIVRLVDGIVITVDSKEGLRAWDVKSAKTGRPAKGASLCLAHSLLTGGNIKYVQVPTSLGVDSSAAKEELGMGIAIGFRDGGFGIWRLILNEEGDHGQFKEHYRRFGMNRNGKAVGSGKSLSAVAYSHPYLLTISAQQLLSVYTFDRPPPHSPNSTEERESIKEDATPVDSNNDQITKDQPVTPPTQFEPESESQTVHPTLLTSLKSHTSWPPLTLSLRSTPLSLIASIAYSFPTYTSGFSVGLQELHLNPASGTIIKSRLASSVESGFHSLLSSPNSLSNSRTGSPSRGGDDSRGNTSQSTNRREMLTRPTSLSYTHPYLLSSHSDNTLSLYLVSSTPSALSISKPTKLWGHTSAVSGAEIGGRGRAVSFAAASATSPLNAATGSEVIRNLGGNIRGFKVPGDVGGGEVRIWELEGGAVGRGRGWRGEEGSVRVWGKEGGVDDGDGDGDGGRDINGTIIEGGEAMKSKKGWVGFDDEIVVVMQDPGSSGSSFGSGQRDGQRLVVYDFT